MDKAILVSQLAAATGRLRPAENATDADLRLLRRLLAGTLFRDESESVAGSAVELGDPVLAAELEAIASAAASDAEAGPTDLRVARRELPILTAQDPASVPAWAAGMAIEQTLGPFVDATGSPTWFDIYRIVRLVPMVRMPSATPFLVLPLRGLIEATTRYELPAGSLWFASRLLSPSAPAGSYTGLRISGGTLSLSSAAVLSGGVLQIPASASGTLTLRLDPPAAPAGGFGPGADASRSAADLPADVTFVFTASGGAVAALADARALMYGTEIRLLRGAGLPYYEPLLNRLLVPLESTRPQFIVSEHRSTVFEPTGAALIQGGAWALPVAVTTPAALGEAAGAGALAVEVAAGLRAGWSALSGGSARLDRAFLMVEPGQLTVVAAPVENRRGRQEFTLWRESADAGRHTSIAVRYEGPFAVRYYSFAVGEELLSTSGTVDAHLDRPLRVDSKRLRLHAPGAALAFYQSASGRVTLFVTASLTPHPPSPMALALANALLKTTAPETLRLAGTLEGDRVSAGTATVTFGLFALVPTLPDPYAANVSLPERSEPGRRAVGRLSAVTSWADPDSPVLSFEMDAAAGHLPIVPVEGGRAAEPSTADEPRFAQLPEEARRMVEEDASRLRSLRELFYRVVMGPPERVFLLDVSSNADQLGVGLGLPAERRVVTGPALRIEGVNLVTAGSNVRVFTVPEIQWEPVRTIQNPFVLPSPFPSPMASADDGGPTLIGSPTVELVPIAPRPVLEQILSGFRREPGSRPVGALFTLPFGMKALATVRLSDDPAARGAVLELNRPEFADPALRGGIQLSVTATSPDAGPDAESPWLPGATVQLRNGIDPATGMPLFLSVLGPDVDTIFNNELGPGRPRARVPLTRIDFSGYGASLFSNWVNPKAGPASVIQARFDVMVGRTAYEVVKVKSLLYPNGAVLVRTITIQRTRNGVVVRADSGWVAVTDGLFEVAGLTFHPGVVRAARNIRNIRDTTQYYKGSGGMELRAVYFDADVEVQGVVRGQQGKSAFVPSSGQLGFVQLAPQGVPLTPTQLRELLLAQGPLGGPVDCVVDVGSSGQRMRVLRVDVSAAEQMGGSPAFVGAARGALALPAGGQWNVLRQEAAGTPQVVDPHGGVPLIRQGETSLPESANPHPYRFSDPADLFRAPAPDAEYGILHSSGAQRLLFRRPKVEKGAKQVTGDRAPLLADTYALLTSPGLFPAFEACLPFPVGAYALDVAGEGQLRMSPPFVSFDAPPGFRRDLSKSAVSRIYADYATRSGTPTRIKVGLDSTADPSWSVELDPVGIVMDADPFAGLVRVEGRPVASSSAPAVFAGPQVIFGSVLAPVQAVITLMSTIGIDPPMLVSVSNSAKEKNWNFKVKLALVCPIPPSPPAPPGMEGIIEVGIGKLLHTKVGISGSLTLEVPVDGDRKVKAFGAFGAEISGILVIRILPPLVAVGLLKVEYELTTKGWTLTLRVAVGVGLEAMLPVLGGAQVWMGIGMELGFEKTRISLAALIILEVFAKVLGVSIKIFAEGKADFHVRVIDGQKTKWIVGELMLGVEVEICQFCEVSFEVEYSVEKEIPPAELP